MTPQAQQYINDIATGKIAACIHVKRAVQRHLQDVENGHKRGLYCNAKAGAIFIAWATTALRWSKGSQVGQNVNLEPWQQFHYCVLFGWRVGSINGPRRFRLSYLEIPRKNGKTPMAALVALYMAFFDGEARAQVYTSATKRDQAKICLNDCIAFVKGSPMLKQHIGTLNNAVFVKTPTGTGVDDNYIHPLSADANTMDGLDIHCGIIDELHAHPDAKLVDVLKTATGARLQPLIYMITTAGDDKTGVCFDFRQYTEKILAGELEDDRFLGTVYTLDENDDYKNPAVWIKANPNLGVSKYTTYIEGEIQESQNRPSYLNTVLKYDFNKWVDAYSAWVPVEQWRKLKLKLTDADLIGKPCVAGLDLASTEDFTALALLFELDPNKFFVKMHFWLPESKFLVRKQRMPHDAKRWVRENWINITPGNVMDDRTLSADIISICNKYRVNALSYDRAKAHTGVVQDISQFFGNEFCIPQGQNIAAMAAPTTQLRKLIEGGTINHDGNPIMAWQLGNVVVYLDANENEKLIKNKSKDKIDGVVALINAVAQQMADGAAVPQDYYNNNDIKSMNLNS